MTPSRLVQEINLGPMVMFMGWSCVLFPFVDTHTHTCVCVGVVLDLRSFTRTAALAELAKS